jgi:very-short-patch-repair endonuclease
MTVIPEFSLGDRLRGDFLVRELNCLIECQGQQHEEFSAFFHGDKDGFRDSKRRDNRKKVLCEQQGLRLVELNEREIMSASGPEELAKLILQKLSNLKQETEW